jgi:hypothetical protein
MIGKTYLLTQKVIKSKILFILLGMFVSCKMLYPDYSLGNDKIKTLEINYKKNYYELKFKPNVFPKYCNKTYGLIGFNTRVPKGIINCYANGHVVFIEYPGKQMIILYYDYKDKYHFADWKLRNYTEDDETLIKNVIYSYLYFYQTDKDEIFNKRCSKRETKIKIDTKINPERITKVYTNGEVKILFVNIKKKNFEKYFDLLKTIKPKDFYADYNLKKNKF